MRLGGILSKSKGVSQKLYSVTFAQLPRADAAVRLDGNVGFGNASILVDFALLEDAWFVVVSKAGSLSLVSVIVAKFAECG